jgi:hypothetical protein
MKQEPLTIIESTGNVFEDLGFKDAKQRLAKAELALCITDCICLERVDAFLRFKPLPYSTRMLFPL